MQTFSSSFLEESLDKLILAVLLIFNNVAAMEHSPLFQEQHQIERRGKIVELATASAKAPDDNCLFRKFVVYWCKENTDKKEYDIGYDTFKNHCILEDGWFTRTDRMRLGVLRLMFSSKVYYSEDASDIANHNVDLYERDVFYVWN